MNPFTALSQSIRRLIAVVLGTLVRRLHYAFYLYLALAFSLFVVVDAAFLHIGSNMRQAAFDVMLRMRLVVPKPDPAIVIVDINEASLAAMVADYGRWPWPRQVLGEFLERLEAQHPRAVVFDILFSDPDVYNPDSDAYFDAAVARTDNTYFPMLRLDPADDKLSRIEAAQIPGVGVVEGETPQPDATIAVVLPFFKSILDGGRLGLNNIYPDPDGVVREYTVFRDDYGWAIPSLPARVVEGLGLKEPEQESVILNWRGKPFTYPTVGFSDVFFDMQRQARQRAPDEFRDKIVIIGSTAPSLFDVKPTPMARLHPGVEILATALDNMKRGDYLRVPEGRIVYPLLSLLLVWSTAWAFYREVGRAKIDRLFGASQFILLGITYASINLGTTYINLTGPVTVALAFFTLARIYAGATLLALEKTSVRASLDQGGPLAATLLLVRLQRGTEGIGDGTLEQMRLALQRAGRMEKSAEVIKGRQRGMWALFEYTFAVSWVVPAAAEDKVAAMRADVAEVTTQLPRLLGRYMSRGSDAADWLVHEGTISGGEGARAAWRGLFAEALLQWNQKGAGK
jgi:CHASE2 domain-containing sensor protein